ncbi:hypothetical protein HanHA300_Chr11g0419911 [Helianthus annuus]|nr:hypothetical protein HanHA300_Chr11g0419911 [Helianthus annuus]KAJ0519020.1 hypothetical protein HanHA89_Chr11g0443921 [Helianthus annuus]KAJ0687020.1 hypothetical protein HanLR1_Chr11g0421211 [Helianthus annuus]
MSVPHFEFAAGEGSQPVEVDDPPSVRFTWKIENFSKFNRSSFVSLLFSPRTLPAPHLF